MITKLSHSFAVCLFISSLRFVYVAEAAYRSKRLADNRHECLAVCEGRVVMPSFMIRFSRYAAALLCGKYNDTVVCLIAKRRYEVREFLGNELSAVLVTISVTSPLRSNRPVRNSITLDDVTLPQHATSGHLE